MFSLVSTLCRGVSAGFCSKFIVEAFKEEVKPPPTLAIQNRPDGFPYFIFPILVLIVWFLLFPCHGLHVSFFI